jgi:hypothetical protein
MMYRYMYLERCMYQYFDREKRRWLKKIEKEKSVKDEVSESKSPCSD